MLFLAVCFLPINIRLNNIFLVCFFISALFLCFIDKKRINKHVKKWKLKLVSLLSLPFILTAAGMLYTDEFTRGVNDVIRATPFVCTPIIGLLRPQLFTDNLNKLGYSLVVGCLFVAFYSWIDIVSKAIATGVSSLTLFSSLNFNHNLVSGLNLHATYVSLCVYAAIGFLVYNYERASSTKKKYITGVLIFVLFLFLLNLLSRNILICFFASSSVYLMYYRKWKLLIIGAVILFGIGYSAYNLRHNYLRDKLFKSFNFFEKESKFAKKDDRFDRLSASYELFLQRPLFGFGTAAESKHRIAIFKRNRDYVAYNEKYNAHNQFFEYLSTYGLVGGMVYLLYFGRIVFWVIGMRRGFFIYITFALVMLTVTESIFERTQGVVFTSIFTTLLFCTHITPKIKHEKLKTLV